MSWLMMCKCIKYLCPIHIIGSDLETNAILTKLVTISKVTSDVFPYLIARNKLFLYKQVSDKDAFN